MEQSDLRMTTISRPITSLSKEPTVSAEVAAELLSVCIPTVLLLSQHNKLTESADTGETTVFGRIAKLSSQPRKGLTTLQKEVLRFVLVIISLVVFIVVLVVTLWYAHSHSD